MSVDMYVSSSQSQASSVSTMCKSQTTGYQELQRAISNFVIASPFLSGKAYDSAKAYFNTVLYPLSQGGILLSEAVEKAIKKFPAEYISQVDSGDLKQSELEESIRQADKLLSQIEDIRKEIKSSKTPDATKAFQLLGNSLLIGIYSSSKRKLEEQLQKLLAFHASSSAIFSEIASLQQAVNQGLVQTKTAWNGVTGTFSVPNNKNMEWTKVIKASWAKKVANEKVTIDGKEFYLGSPSKPSVEFDNDFPYDPNLSPTSEDKENLRDWKIKLLGAQILGHLPDGTAIYSHYLNGDGKDYVVDFEKGYRQDSNIKMNVDAEIARMQQAAEAYYNKTGETNFSLTSSASSIQGYPETENWQKTLGGFQIWSNADVKVTDGKFEIDVKVNAIDRYNFNKGQQDITTQTPDEVNGRFESLGWANSFDVSGEIQRDVSWQQGNINNSNVSDGPGARIGEGENR